MRNIDITRLSTISMKQSLSEYCRHNTCTEVPDYMSLFSGLLPLGGVCKRDEIERQEKAQEKS